MVAVIALIAGWGSTASGSLEIFILNGVFAALWLISAWLFGRAALEPARAVSAHAGTDGGEWDD